MIKHWLKLTDDSTGRTLLIRIRGRLRVRQIAKRNRYYVPGQKESRVGERPAPVPFNFVVNVYDGYLPVLVYAGRFGRWIVGADLLRKPFPGKLRSYDRWELVTRTTRG